MSFREKKNFENCDVSHEGGQSVEGNYSYLFFEETPRGPKAPGSKPVRKIVRVGELKETPRRSQEFPKQHIFKNKSDHRKTPGGNRYTMWAT